MTSHFIDLTCLLAAETSEPNAVMGLLQSVWAIVQVILGLGFVIFVHELGHFLAAKSFGVKCEKFYVGFDVPIHIGPIRLPSALWKKQWGETEYGIGAIPLGGYVKMLGQDDDPRNAEAERERIRQASGQADELDPKAHLDPRSYPAKSVIARMIIISAGVIMNLIFAVLMAAVAYRFGVSYTPTIVATVSAGDPAWQAGIQPGDHIIQMQGMRQPDPQMHFKDMVENIMVIGLGKQNAVIPFTVERDDQELEFEIPTTLRHDPDSFRSQIGVAMTRSTQVDEQWPETVMYQVTPALKEVDLQPGDRIVGVEGELLPVDSRTGQIEIYSLKRLVDSKFQRPVTLQVERRDESNGLATRDVELPTIALRTLGLAFQPAGITAIQNESPASEAGIQIGDQLVAMNGSPIVDGVELHLQVLSMAGQSVTLTMQKPDAEEVYEFAFEVPADPIVGTPAPYSPVGYELYGSGLTFDVSPVVSGVDNLLPSDSSNSDSNAPPDLSPSTSLQPGDEISEVQIQVSDTEFQEFRELGFFKASFDEIKIGKGYSIVWLHEFIQSLPVGTNLRVDYKRDGKFFSTLVKVRESAAWNVPDRLPLMASSDLKHVTDSVSSSLAMGAHETWKRVKGVGNFLRLAFRGKISRKAFGGPGVIVYAASSAASDGTTALLLFLVMLSANLAVLNFLPIPALDGGHMVFLIAEAVLGRPIDENLQAKLTFVGVICLLMFMAFVLVNDAINLTDLFSR